MLQLIIPLKDISLAKSRLGGTLDDSQREQLVAAMAGDLIELARCQSFISSVTVVLGENWDRRLFRATGVWMLPESDLDGAGLNGLLRSAVNTLKPSRALVMHGDLPFVGAEDLDDLRRHLNRLELLLCPDARKEGTNALAFRAAATPQFRFGTNSYEAHRRFARELGCAWWAFSSPGLSRDIDRPEDLRGLLRDVRTGARTGLRTRAWVERFGDALLSNTAADQHAPANTMSGRVVRGAVS